MLKSTSDKVFKLPTGDIFKKGLFFGQIKEIYRNGEVITLDFKKNTLVALPGGQKLNVISLTYRSNGIMQVELPSQDPLAVSHDGIWHHIARIYFEGQEMFVNLSLHQKAQTIKRHEGDNFTTVSEKFNIIKLNLNNKLYFYGNGKMMFIDNFRN